MRPPRRVTELERLEHEEAVRRTAHDHASRHHRRLVKRAGRALGHRDEVRRDLEEALEALNRVAFDLRSMGELAAAAGRVERYARMLEAERHVNNADQARTREYAAWRTVRNRLEEHRGQPTGAT